MFGLPKKRKRERQPMPPWLKWLLMGFLLVGVLGNMNKKLPVHGAVEQASENLNPKKLLHWEEYKNKIFPRYEASLHVRDIAPGEGALAVCGQKVKVAYDTVLGNDKPGEDKADKDQPLAFTIGDGKAMPAFEQGVLGMRGGGRRSIVSPPKMAYGIPAFSRPDVPPNTTARFEVTLLEVSPVLPKTQDTPFRIAVIHGGSGPGLQCGDPAKIHLTLWGIEGKKLFSTHDDGQPLSFTPGKSEVFLGLEQGVVGMARGEIRTLIVPPSYQKTMHGNAPAIAFPFPKDQTVLADIEALP